MTATNSAERNVDREVPQVVRAGADDRAAGALGRRLAPSAGHRHPQLAAEIPPGERLGMPQDVLDGAFGDHFAAEAPRARAEVDDVVGRRDRLGVVLDDDHRVAEIAQPAKRGEQPLVVALVQTDARLVEDVEHAHEPRADLRREPDALRLAARERRGRRGPA